MWQDRVTEFLLNDNWQNSQEWQQTNLLKSSIQTYRIHFPNQGLSEGLFNQIIQWKLGDQIHRVNHHLQYLNKQMINEVTKTALILNHHDYNILTRVRINILRSLPGVGLGIASAILTLYYPELYGIIDFRTWDEINERDPVLPSITHNFSIGDYLNYLTNIRPYASEQNIEVQVIDYALWKIWELRRD
ncbi:MAG: hypothetical protein HRU80_02810 [Ignavibacteriales bacterium]|nr:MAG: hypothetical protein HRU80_02810 [Ignavibacteriales bacterium]